MDTATAWTLGISALSACAACVAVGYAHATVRQGREGQREAHQWRREDAEERRHEREESSRAHAEHIAALRRIQEASIAAHEREMAERKAAAESELRLARVRALENIADALAALVTRAQEEAINPPPPTGPYSPARRTSLPTILLRLKVAAAAYAGLGGPEVKEVNKLAEDYVMASDNADKWVGLGVTALDEVLRVARELQISDARNTVQ